MSYKFNPLTGQFDLVENNTESIIPQYFEDPESPNPEEVWVRCSVPYPIVSILSHTLLHFGLTTGEQKVVVPDPIQHTILQVGATTSYQLKDIGDVAEYELRFRTKQNITKGVKLT